jgi:mRNA-degrading endonuclease RelE of RelBE toxin-antitoxin system
VVKYSLDIKQSAQKELDALDDALFNRIDRKILALADNPRPTGCKKLNGYIRSVARARRQLASALRYRRRGEASQYHADRAPPRGLRIGPRHG